MYGGANAYNSRQVQDARTQLLISTNSSTMFNPNSAHCYGGGDDGSGRNGFNFQAEESVLSHQQRSINNNIIHNNNNNNNINNNSNNNNVEINPVKTDADLKTEKYEEILRKKGNHYNVLMQKMVFEENAHMNYLVSHLSCQTTTTNNNNSNPHTSTPHHLQQSYTGGRRSVYPSQQFGLSDSSFNTSGGSINSTVSSTHHHYPSLSSNHNQSLHSSHSTSSGYASNGSCSVLSSHFSNSSIPSQTPTSGGSISLQRGEVSLPAVVDTTHVNNSSFSSISVNSNNSFISNYESTPPLSFSSPTSNSVRSDGSSRSGTFYPNQPNNPVNPVNANMLKNPPVQLCTNSNSPMGPNYYSHNIAKNDTSNCHYNVAPTLNDLPPLSNENRISNGVANPTASPLSHSNISSVSSKHHPDDSYTSSPQSSINSSNWPPPDSTSFSANHISIHNSTTVDDNAYNEHHDSLNDLDITSDLYLNGTLEDDILKSEQLLGLDLSLPDSINHASSNTSLNLF